MSKVTLLGAAGLAVSLMAAPAYAQNAGGAGTGGAANNGTAGVGVGDNNVSTGGGAGGVGNTAGGGNMASGGGGGMENGTAVVGNGRYANVGFGSYVGEQFYIRNNGGNNGGGAGIGGGGAGGGNGGGNNNANNNWRPSQRNPVLADNGDARASKVIGTAVYNELNQKLGNVNDILLGTNGVFAVIATNNKQVAVPFGDLMFGNATNQGDEKVVMPNETEARLNTLPVFHYNVTNYPGVNANNFGNNNFSGGYAAGGANGAGANGGANGIGMGGGANGGGVGVSSNLGGAGNARSATGSEAADLRQQSGGVGVNGGSPEGLSTDAGGGAGGTGMHGTTIGAGGNGAGVGGNAGGAGGSTGTGNR